MSGPQPPWGDPYGSGVPDPYGRSHQSPPPAHAPNPAPPAYEAVNFIQHPPGAFAPPEQQQVSPPQPPTRERRSGSVLPAMAAASVIALVVGGAAGYGGARLAADPVPSPAQPLASTPAAPSAPMDAVTVADRLLDSTVTIAYRSASSGGTGSGFVLDNEGHIVTNNHVIEGAARGDARVTVEFADGSRVPASIVGRSASYDLAVLRVDANKPLQPIPLGDSSRVEPGQAVLAVGAPLGLGGSVTAGIVSAVDRPLGVGEESTVDEGAGIAYINGIQTDAAINPGNSGGPLADAHGYVIGVNSAILTLGGGGTGGRSGNIGLGFAIPINQAKVISAEIMRAGHATYPVIEATVGLDQEGVRVTDVSPGGPADQAGLRPGDVVTAVAGVRVDDPTDLIVRIRTHRPGERIPLEVQGRGPVTVTLGAKVG
jgi:putative serine protease PepD